MVWGNFLPKWEEMNGETLIISPKLPRKKDTKVNHGSTPKMIYFSYVIFTRKADIAQYMLWGQFHSLLEMAKLCLTNLKNCPEMQETQK